MFINFTQFNEAIKLSDAKRYIKIWQASEMQNYLNNWFKDNDRIYIPLNMNISLKELQHDTDIEKEVETVLTSNGYEIESYVGNLCKKIGTNKNFTKITKILQKIDANLVEQFNNELINMGVTNDYMVVISRHPIDIAGMSTDRGWRSCMDLDGGQYNDFVYADIKYGTIIAYLIKNDDKNIQSPISRLLMKPYIDRNGKSWLFPDKVYGTPNQFFQKTIELWLEEMQGKSPSGLYNIKNGLYVDKSKNVKKFDTFEDKVLDFVKTNYIEKYKINDDESIDILEDFNQMVSDIPIKINAVFGEFRIVNCHDFTNFPKIVKGDFIIIEYYGTSLYGCPKIVEGRFSIQFMSEYDVTLFGMPKQIGKNCSLSGAFVETQRVFKNLKNIQQCNIGGDLSLKNLQGLTDLNFLPKTLKSFEIRDCDIKSTNGISNCNIKNDISITKCRELTKLEDFPKVVNGTLNLERNNIDEVSGFPEIVNGDLCIGGNYLTASIVKTKVGGKITDELS